MKEPRRLSLEPDWPRIRRLAAKRLRTTEEEVDRMRVKRRFPRSSGTGHGGRGSTRNDSPL